MTEPRSSWMPRVPGWLQCVFDRFPLVTYAPNELPAGSPGLGGQEPTLYVFAREEHEASGFPSVNPSCLKWQLFLKLAGVRVNVAPSSNHASPTGSLPFLIAARQDHSRPTRVVPASRLHDYALQHGRTKVPEAPELRTEAYQALLDGPIRKAYLHALYLEPSSTSLLIDLYIRPTTSATPVQAALLRQLRRAAEAEILKATPGAAAVDAERIYSDAREALAALETALASSPSAWFWGAEDPNFFDASVFAYTGLLIGGGAAFSLWPDVARQPSALRAAIEASPIARLREHQSRLWDVLQTDLGPAAALG